MEIVNDERPVARKPHQCLMCLRQIEAGETYTRQRCLNDGAFYTWRNCAHCAVFMSVIVAVDGMSDEGISRWDADEFEPETDLKACAEGFVSVTPLRLDLTADAFLDRLSGALA